jgi:metal-responsive CopG/Arc/MetJ family transcriptional regulator
MKTRVSVSMDVDVLRELDQHRSLIPRSAYLERLVRESLATDSLSERAT